MKRLILVVCICLCLHPVQAQKKDNASKEETIGYLNLKAKEIIGYTKVSVSQKAFLNKRNIAEGYVRKTATGVELHVVYSTPTYTFFTYTTFNPKHIISITKSGADNVSPDSPVGALEIKLIGKTALFNNNGDSTTVDKAVFNFLQSDPGNEGRIINALMHLKDLYKAEDALFEK